MARHSVPTNTNLETGIAFGYISANSLNSDLVNDLQMNGTDVYYEDAWKEFISGKRFEFEEQREATGTADDYDDFDEEDFRDEFNDNYNPDEPIHEGTHEGVSYRTSWLGGALNVWIFESPRITHTARQCSPCVPGAGDLNSEGDYTCYDVPPDWRDNTA